MHIVTILGYTNTNAPRGAPTGENALALWPQEECIVMIQYVNIAIIANIAVYEKLNTLKSNMNISKMVKFLSLVS